IQEGNFFPTVTVEGVDIPKPKDKFTDRDKEKVHKNNKAINVLMCALSAEEYHRVSACSTAKDIWDDLVNTYEGTSQVRQSKIRQYLGEYELFQVGDDESITTMYKRFTEITNNLANLNKPHTEEEKVRKILICLAQKKWGPKVTAIEEAQDLSKLKPAELTR